MARTPLVVIDVVALTGRLLRHAPRLAAMAKNGTVARLTPSLPAVTSTVQSSLLTGSAPDVHGIVGNGWYFRDLAQVWLWRQSNHLVHGEKLWEMARRRAPGFRCAKLFWWFNMYSTADWSVTPRPVYYADGRKRPDVYTAPAPLRDELVAELGDFPLFEFWGPRAGIRSSEWIARATRHVIDRHAPDLTLAYLPHLDYDLQRVGPDHPSIPAQVAAIDRCAGELAEHCLTRGARVVVVSEYGIERVDRALRINEVLDRAGWLAVQETPAGDLLDPGASRAFAVADHQVAHVYVRDVADVPRVQADLAAGMPGVELFALSERRAVGLDHPRSGEIVAFAPRGGWFSYRYWRSDARAPDFARTVDIHRKPGYDPCELFLDPRFRVPTWAVAWRLLRAKLGFRGTFDVIPLDDSLVKGSHGGRSADPLDLPLLLSSAPLDRTEVAATDFPAVAMSLLFDAPMAATACPSAPTG